MTPTDTTVEASQRPANPVVDAAMTPVTATVEASQRPANPAVDAAMTPVTATVEASQPFQAAMTPVRAAVAAPCVQQRRRFMSVERAAAEVVEEAAGSTEAVVEEAVARFCARVDAAGIDEHALEQAMEAEFQDFTAEDKELAK
eukprot:156960-Karenia_brevis.AAC.1